MENGQNSAPALENGLEILELLAQSNESVGFNAIDSKTSVSRATTARLLKVLLARGWIDKEELSGKYLPGKKAVNLMRGSGLREQLRNHSTAILPYLAEESQNTCITMFWDGNQMECINKETHMSSASMQPVGRITIDLSQSPWGWIVYSLLPPDLQKREQTHFMHKAQFSQHYETAIAHYRKHGFAYDEEWIYPRLRRLGAVVFDAQGKIAGALGMGGSRLTIQNNQVKHLGGILVRHASKLSAMLGWKDEPSEKKERGKS